MQGFIRILCIPPQASFQQRCATKAVVNRLKKLHDWGWDWWFLMGVNRSFGLRFLPLAPRCLTFWTQMMAGVVIRRIVMHERGLHGFHHSWKIASVSSNSITIVVLQGVYHRLGESSSTSNGFAIRQLLSPVLHFFVSCSMMKVIPKRDENPLLCHVPSELTVTSITSFGAAS